jgi:hypothetical protein
MGIPVRWLVRTWRIKKTRNRELNMDRWKYEKEKEKENESNAGRGGLTQNKRTGTKRVMCGRGDIL